MFDQINAASAPHLPPSPSEPTLTADPLPLSNQPQKFQSPGSWLRRVSLKTKATAIALAIGTLPILGIGAIAYYFADQAIKKEIITTQQASATGLSDKLNRFMLERYGDVQVLTRLPALNDAKTRETTSIEDKQALLDQVVEVDNSYRSIAVVDLEGRVQFQSRGSKLQNQKDQLYFQSVLKGDNSYIESRVAPDSQKDPVIHFAAPVRDNATGKTIAIVRTIVALPQIEDVIRDYQTSGRNYYILDSTGKIFIASQKNQLGRDARTEFPGLASLQAAKQSGSFVGSTPLDRTQQLVSYVPRTTLPGLPLLDWEVILAADTTVAFAPQRGLLTTLAIGTLLTSLAVGILAAAIARRAIRPILKATEVVEKLGQGELNTRVAVQGEDELALLSAHINQMANQLQHLLHQQTQSAQTSQRLSLIISNLRQSLRSSDILQTAADEVRAFLQVDRVLVSPIDSRPIEIESVAPGWSRAEGKVLEPLTSEAVDRYRSGKIWIVPDVRSENLTSNQRTEFEQLNVQAALVAPLLCNQAVVGLLCAHQCSSPRAWQPESLDFFAQLAVQIGYALDEAALLQQTEQARQQAETLSEERRQQKEALQQQLLNLLSEVEAAVQGDLTVRADVTVGEIGTVADFFNSIVESLRQIVTQVKQAAAQVNTSLNSDEQAIRSLAQTAVQQASETSRTLHSMEQMLDSIQAVSASAQQAAAVSHRASVTAEAGGTAINLIMQNILSLRETMGETAKKVKRLGESSQQISKVVSLINQIALQTNLLAINAGIEAARSGEESQGFAIVAEEVGELAARSGAATREIEQIVATIQRETSEVVEAMEAGTSQVVEETRLVENAKQSLEEILAVSHQIDELVQSISDATVSQVETSQAVTRLMQTVVQVAGHTSDSSLQVSDSLRQTVAVAQALQKSVGTFKVS